MGWNSALMPKMSHQPGNPVAQGPQREPVRCFKCDKLYPPGHYDEHIRHSSHPVHLGDKRVYGTPASPDKRFERG